MEVVIVKNTGKKPFVDKWNGVTYSIPPGKARAVPVGAAKNWMGDWTLTGSERRDDLRRASYRRGGLPSLEIVQEDEPQKDDE